MKQIDRQSGFGVVEVLVVVIVVLVLGFGGYVAYDRTRQADDTPMTANSSTDASVDTLTTGAPLELSSLGIKVNDPENRGLESGTFEGCGAESCSTLLGIRDNDDAYFAACNYPAGITKISASQAADNQSRDPSYYASLTKQINGQWYQVTAGTHFQSPCKVDDQTGDSYYRVYEDGLRQYIADNLAAL